jgi:hypothetical protein
MSDSGMKVVWVGRAASSEWGVASEWQDGMNGEDTSANGVVEVVESQAMSARSYYCGTSYSGTNCEIRATRRRQNACAACQSPLLAPAKAAWDDGATIVSRSKEKGPEPLLIDAAGDPGKGLTTGADHEDAAFVLPFKGRLAPRAHHEDGTLLNPYQRPSNGSHEIILHNKTFKNEKITAKAACSIQCGMSAGQKESGINARIASAELLAEAGAG